MILKELLKIFFPTVVYLGLLCNISSRCRISLLVGMLQGNVEYGLVLLVMFGFFYQLNGKLFLSFVVVNCDSVYLVFVCVCDLRRLRFIVF
jgi:hypothetical protein